MTSTIRPLIDTILTRLSQNEEVVMDYIDDYFSPHQMIDMLAYGLSKHGIQVEKGSIELCNQPLETYKQNLTQQGIRYYHTPYLISEGEWMKIEWSGYNHGFSPKWTDDPDVFLKDLIRQKERKAELTHWYAEILEDLSAPTLGWIHPALQKGLECLIDEECVLFQQNQLKERIPDGTTQPPKVRL